MDCIHFEKQEDALCAQHALNMLLQGSYFSASDLAELACQIDRTEASVLNVAEERSQNVNESGYFSVQVLAEALHVFNLDIVPLNSQRASEYRQNPTSGHAYICNLNEHWFVIRKLGFQWFILDSLKSQPELCTDTYLHLLIEQLIKDGYTIFLVEGTLPSCTADHYLTVSPANPTLAVRPEPLSDVVEKSSAIELQNALDLSRSEAEKREDADLQSAIEASKIENFPDYDDDEWQLRLAKQLSLNFEDDDKASKK